MPKLTLVVPGRPANMNDREERYGRAKIVKAMHEHVHLCAKEQWGIPFWSVKDRLRYPVSVHVRHLANDNLHRDTGNAFPAVKALVDALTGPKDTPEEGLWPKDTPQWVGAYVFYPPRRPTAREAERLTRMGSSYAPSKKVDEWLVVTFVWT